MKATKKIVGAACALVAAVALSAGSTFAWFASSNTVTATEMRVQATVPMSLYIEQNYELDITKVTKNTININDSTVTELSPAAISTDTGAKLKTISGAGATATATVNDFTNEAVSSALNVLTPPGFTTAEEQAKWEIVPTSDKAGILKATGYDTSDTLTFASTGVSSDTGKSDAYKKFVYKQDMTLANKSMEINVGANVTASFTKDGTDTFKFLRVGFVVGTPVYDTDNTTISSWSYAFTSLKNDVSAATNSGTTDSITFEYEDLIKNFKQNSLVTVSFLVWFDGDDADCFVDNAVDVSTFTIDIEYVGANPTAGGTD